MLLLSFKRIISSPARWISLALVCFLLRYFVAVRDNGYNAYLYGGLANMIIVIPYLFLFFLFFSYDFFYSYHKDNFNEVLCSKRISLQYQKYDFFVLFLLIGAVSVYMGRELLAFFQRKGVLGTYIVKYSIRVCLIYVFLVLLSAVFAGWLMSSVKSRISGICALMTLFYCFDMTFIQTILAADINSRAVYKISTLFSVIHTQMPGMITDVYYLMTAENVHLYAVLFWLLLVLGLLFFRCGRYLLSAVSFLLCLICLLAFMASSGASYGLPVINRFDRWRGDPSYYSEERIKKDEEKYILQGQEDFQVEKYVLDFRVTDRLEASAVLTLSEAETEREMYRFTLYHSYQVNKITDQDGVQMDYVQDGDYLCVMPNGGKTASITFFYSGGNECLYSTSQGIYLPANFEYFPVAGWQRTYLMDSRNSCFTNEMKREESEFEISLRCSADLKVFSNFAVEQVSRERTESSYKIRGKSNGCTILGSPFAVQTQVDGLRVVYSSIDPVFLSGNAVEECRAFAEYLEQNEIPCAGKTLIVPPDGTHFNCCFASDHFVDQPYKVIAFYEKYLKQGNTYDYPEEGDRQKMEEALQMLEDVRDEENDQ